ncbi:MAG TPA: hypothetical protein VFZ57_00725 [Thermoanaerobaculia bacterium]|nr:hypothetical protein [Thermoanaerobaculia bacterium]
MRITRLPSRFSLAAAALALCAAAAPLPAASRSADALLSLVPADAASVAVIRLNDLRESPLSARLFAGADHMTVDGDAARFLEEAQLNPKKDVDTIVIAGRPSAGGKGSPTLVLFEGRFDPDKLARAAEGRGAVRKSTPAGEYFLLPEGHHHGHGDDQSGAVAFAGPKLVIAGTEPAVAQALADRQAGGTGFASGAGLGRELKRVDRGASVWALVDVTRYPAVANRSANVHISGDADGEPAVAIMGVMKSVSLVAFQAKASGDALELSATGITSDAETRQLLEDSLRGLMAMWRLAVQDKAPEMVTMIRRFSVSSDGEGVSVRGTLPAAFIRSIAEKAEKKRSESHQH